MKLTNASVAKALGYRMTRGGQHTIFSWWTPTGMQCQLPAFTTSLDAIVGEIEARGLTYELEAYNDSVNGPRARVGRKTVVWQVWKTAPLALCQALLEFLKSERSRK